MKNIEKYHETKAAIEAYNHQKSKNVPFDVWLECDYEEPREKTLLEAAEAVTDEWYDMRQNINCNDIGKIIVDLEKAIAREKAKPVRNCDKYKTAKDAFAGFNEMCNEKTCYMCPFSAGKNECLNCNLNWLFAEAEKEVSK